MQLLRSQTMLGVLRTASVCLLGVVSAYGQAGSEQKPQIAEDVFKNVQVLKGISVN